MIKMTEAWSLELLDALKSNEVVIESFNHQRDGTCLTITCRNVHGELMTSKILRGNSEYPILIKWENHMLCCPASFGINEIAAVVTAISDGWNI